MIKVRTRAVVLHRRSLLITLLTGRIVASGHIMVQNGHFMVQVTCVPHRVLVGRWHFGVIDNDKLD